jgi:glycosyltransferase involved in cell wall biosynthesis
VKFTIVTISYNQAQYLDDCIMSVLGQNYPDVEYIVADGGSTDGSLDVIDRHRRHLNRILTGPDGGPADALNRGFAVSTGDILGYVNSDDLLLPGAIRKVADFLARHPEVDFVSGHCVITGTRGEVLRYAYSDRVARHRWIYSGCILIQPATFFRRYLYEEAGGFNVGNRISWDIELFHRFIKNGARHAVLDQHLAAFRIHPSSITGAGQTAHRRLEVRNRLLRESLGRELRWTDAFWRLYYKYARKLLNPRDTWERIRHGPYGGRFARRA